MRQEQKEYEKDVECILDGNKKNNEPHFFFYADTDSDGHVSTDPDFTR